MPREVSAFLSCTEINGKVKRSEESFLLGLELNAVKHDDGKLAHCVCKPKLYSQMHGGVGSIKCSTT